MKKPIRILLNNNKSRLVGSLKVIIGLNEETKLRVKNWFFARGTRGWDGYIKYVSEETGMFPTGMLQQITKILRDWKIPYTIEDQRPVFKDLHEIGKLGQLKAEGKFSYQADVVRALLDNRVEGIRFQRGLLNEATNAGKNFIAAMIFASFSTKRKGLFLIDNTEIFTQAVRELKELLPGEIGFVSSKKIELKRINVCMVQTLARRIKKDPQIRAMASNQDIILVDEVDTTGTRKDVRYILGYSPNATVRVGLSGTVLRPKEKTHNQELINYFGPVLHVTRNIELVQRGVSTPPDIRIYLGNTKVRMDRDYKGEYWAGIVESEERCKKIWRKVWKFRRRVPILILTKLHAQQDFLLNCCPEKIKDKYRVAAVHHETPNRTQIIDKFKAGNIDILIGSMIIRRGMNISLIKAYINGAGGSAEHNVLQQLGRALRKHKSKESVLVIDFWDLGAYLRRHSKHRLMAYQNEGFPVKEVYKLELKKLLDKI